MKRPKNYAVPFFLTLSMAAGLVLAACSPAPATTDEPGDETEATDEAGGEEAEATDEAGGEEASGDVVEIRWFVGLGAGSDEPTFAPQQAVVDEFNATHDDIELVLEIVDADVALDTLATQIAAGNAPDIAGPVGIKGRDAFKGAWLDLQPLIDANEYDLSDFDPALVDFYHVQEEGQLGIPFAIYPSFIFYNEDLFDEAGLPYPPQEYGQPYVDENGDEHEWNMDTVRELAMKLTVDAEGNDATSEDFDPESIVQFGYLEQFTDMRGAFSTFGSGNLIDDEGNAAFPENWVEGAEWIYNGMWEDHFYPTDAYVNSEVLGNNNPFQSGNLAMTHLHMWFAAPWALGEADYGWNLAAMPSHNGVTTAKMHADTFGILKSTEHPEEAFEVLTYLLSEETAAKLLQIYGGMPARLSMQDAYFETYSEANFPGLDINWQVVADSAAYADNPNHESYLPSYQESVAKYGEYFTRWAQEPGLDLSAEIDSLVNDLQAIYDAADE